MTSSSLLALSLPSIALLLLLPTAVALSPDGLSLLAFKSAVTSDPTAALSSWNADDPDPCRWLGVSCANISGFPTPRVVAVSITNKNLSGHVPSEFGRLPFLRRLNLHGNQLSGEVPLELSNATSLHSLFLYSNNLTGTIPSQLCSLPRLQNLDLSSNSFSGSLPVALRSCRQLQRLLLSSNSFFGVIPAEIFPNLTNLVQLDLSSNNLTGPIPPDLSSLRSLSGTLNLSNNHLSGSIPADLANLPQFVVVDLRNNDLSGEIPQIGILTSHGDEFLLGNPGLCGYPLAIPCNAPRSTSPKGTTAAARRNRGRVSTWLIAVISAADVVGVAVIGIMVVYVYWKVRNGDGDGERESSKGLLCCGRDRGEEVGSESTGSEEGERVLVAVDRGFRCELDELLRASAYVLGKGARGIVYKVVLADGTAVAVRRVGGEEGGSSSGRYKEFAGEVREIGKVKHPNVVRLCAYYWAHDEKLLITDFVPGGNLASAIKARAGQPPLPWSARLHIIKGIARGLSYIHECSPRKFVHGEIKPSNILLDADFKPCISDFGLNRLLSIATSDIPSSSTSSYTTLGLPITKHSPSLKDRSSNYRAPEARLSCSTRPLQKWDVYSFGVVALELLTGKSPEQGDPVRLVRKKFDEERPITEILDATLLEDMQVKKEAMAVFRLALGCTETDPESRPRMKAIVEALEKIG